MAEETNSEVKNGVEEEKSVTTEDFYPANVCPICFTQGSSETNNERHLAWHSKKV